MWIAVIGTAICVNAMRSDSAGVEGLERDNWISIWLMIWEETVIYDQKPIAELMGEMADAIGPECVFAAGDVHHFEGTQCEWSALDD